ncbi:hypothetical protein psal_cds_772 [Pandoravirus salinus]|uniref:Uncharacterized protein n=1 Tax=Pandoravirus salinus TaxID=1349410 RepID=S4W2M0_9VIRU|nr:hypothetical protein psal_cds_772 [Pandoravirus salinus]AGO84772.1 hypothetical protein psal_cds_772 [Pandoravirus salinus]
MDTLPAEIGCMILGYLEPTWVASASMASRGLCQWSALVCRGEAPRMPHNAMEVAAADGAWDFMQWLRHHLYWPWTPVTLATAALHNQRLVFERLLKGRTCSVDARAAAAALVGGGPALLHTALQYGCPKSGLLTTVACLVGRDRLALRLLRTTVPDDLMNLCGLATRNWQIELFMTPEDWRRAYKWLSDPDRAPFDLRVAARQIAEHRGTFRALARKLALGEIARRPPPSPSRPSPATDPSDWLHYCVDEVLWKNNCLFSDRRQWHEEGPPCRLNTVPTSTSHRPEPKKAALAEKRRPHAIPHMQPRKRGRRPWR